MLLHYTQRLFGDSELALRLPSAICGILCIIAIFLLGKKLFSEREALISAAIMAVMWCPIYYSQEARSYIFLILFSILSLYFWVSIMQDLKANKKPRNYDIVSYIAFSTLCCYTHYFGGYLIALQGMGAVILFIWKKAAWRHIFIIYISILALFSPWLPVFQKHLARAPSAVSDTPISLMYFVKFIGFIFGAQKSLFIPLKAYSKNDVLISAAIILVAFGFIFSFALIKLYIYIKKKTNRKTFKYFVDPDILLLLWLVIPFLGIYISHQIPRSHFNYFYLLISLPPAYLLLSRAITLLFSTSRSQLIVVSLFSILFGSHLIFYKNYYSKPDKEQYREAVNYVIQNDKHYEESKIIGYTYDRFFDYYINRSGFTKEIAFYVNPEKEKVPALNKINLIQTKYIWLISAPSSPDEGFLKHLSKRYNVVTTKKFVLASVCLFEKI